MTKGFKVTNPDGRCRGFQFEVGQVYEQPGKLEICSNGFHFCEKVSDCFSYYDFSPINRVFEVEALEEVITEVGKSCTNKLGIIKELTWAEMLDIANTGKGNTGLNNSGDRNSGDRNSGYRNSGYMNSGYMNSGVFNKTNHSSGAFCTEEPDVLIFDSPSNLKMRDILNSQWYSILNWICAPTQWVNACDMDDMEKKNNPDFVTLEGYLKILGYEEAWKLGWTKLTDAEKKYIIENVPNFDAEKFFKITGIKI